MTYATYWKGSFHLRWRKQRGFHPWRCFCNQPEPRGVSNINIRASCCGGRSYGRWNG